MNGIIVVDKEKGYTSRDVVNKVGKIIGSKKIGHIGTLDPMATGVLVLCVGKALKVVELLMEHDKEYIATFRLGILTDTLDITGNIVKECSYDVNINKIKKVLDSFIGDIKQVVPIYSSVKVKGKKLYEYARSGEEVELPVKDITIYNIELLNYKDGEVTIKCFVSKGTYIRSLVRDIGEALGTCATLIDLRRVKLGNINIDKANTISDIESGNYNLLDIRDVLDLPVVIVDSDIEKKVKNGQVLSSFFDDDMSYIVNRDNVLLAIYKHIDKNNVKPYRVF